MFRRGGGLVRPKGMISPMAAPTTQAAPAVQHAAAPFAPAGINRYIMRQRIFALGQDFDINVEFGQVVGKLLGLPGMSAEQATADTVESVLADASRSVGLDYPGLRKLVENLEPGKAFGVLMFEHTWAIPLRDAIR